MAALCRCMPSSWQLSAASTLRTQRRPFGGDKARGRAVRETGELQRHGAGT